MLFPCYPRNASNKPQLSYVQSLPPTHCHIIPTPELTRRNLILPSRRLTSLQLIQIPPTNGQISLILIHALAEVANLHLAHLRRRIVRVNGVLVVVLLSDGLLRGRGGFAAATTAEETADGMADGGADCDATATQLLVRSRVRVRSVKAMTYAAVLAIWPNNPGLWPCCA